jgi:hypothetical protein
MTESEEVAWMNSLGFKVTLAELQASYAKFVVQPVSATSTNVLWGTETDWLRNWYRLYKRTGHQSFLDQAREWHDFNVNTYSQWQNGGRNVVEPEHVYLMGLIDWYVDTKDPATLDAINRILDFIEQKIRANPFYETRVSARCIQCLAYYLEKIGTRRADVLPTLQNFITGVQTATQGAGLVCMKFWVGTNMTADGMPPGDDLTKLFPSDVTFGCVTGPDAIQIKGFEGAGVYQDCMLIHALSLAGRVLQQPALGSLAVQIASAWEPHTVFPFWDPKGSTTNLIVPYYLVPAAPDTSVFHCYDGSSTPLYITQYAANCPNPTLRKTLAGQALLRQYGEYTKIAPAEFGGLPRYFLWQTWQAGYFLTQK